MPALASQVIPLLQSEKYKPKNDVDFSDALFRLQIVAKDYKNL